MGKLRIALAVLAVNGVGMFGVAATARAEATTVGWFTTYGATYLPELAGAAAQYASTGSVGDGVFEPWSVTTMASADGATSAEAIVNLGPPPAAGNFGAIAVVQTGGGYVAGVVLAVRYEQPSTTTAAPAAPTSTTMPAGNASTAPARTGTPSTSSTSNTPNTSSTSTSSTSTSSTSTSSTNSVESTVATTSTLALDVTSSTETTETQIGQRGADSPATIESTDSGTDRLTPAVVFATSLAGGFAGVRLGRRRKRN